LYYPEKLYVPPAIWRLMVAIGHIEIPDGPWHVANHPHRTRAGSRIEPTATVDQPIDSGRVNHWQTQGLLVDTAGRPLHPYASQLLTRHDIGMCTGPGFHYGYGPQLIGNLGLRRQRVDMIEYAVVAVERSGQLIWSLPGGYAAPGETSMQAAFREANEEAAIQLSKIPGSIIQQWPLPLKVRQRDTLHAWTEETFTMVRSIVDPELALIALFANDGEARLTRWMGLDEIQAHPDFVGTHKAMILWYEASL